MFIDKLRDAEGFTSAEQVVAEYILNHIYKLQELTAEELAENTTTSKATISRLCRKLGARSYRDMKVRIMAEANEYAHIQNLLRDDPVNEKSSYEDIINVIPSLYEAAILHMKTKLDKVTVIRVVQKMKAAEKIDIYATGNAKNIAQAFAFKMMTLGKECGVYDGLNEHYIMADGKRKEKVVLVLSMRGNNRSIINIARKLKKQGYYIVGIGGHHNEELRGYCAEYITVRVPKELLSLEILSSHTAFTYVMDVLFASALVADYKNHIENSIHVIKDMAEK